MTVLRGLVQRLRLAKVLLITGTRSDAGDLTAFTDAAFSGGVDFVQVRDPHGRPKQQRADYDTIRTVAQRYHGLVGLYDLPDLAQQVGADVLHLPPDGMTAARAHRYLHEYALVGRSCQTVDEVDAALADPAVAYLTVGPVFDGLAFFGRTPGLELVKHAAEKAPQNDRNAKPWFAVGGITIGSLDEVLAAGARRIAVGRAITDAPDTAEAARVLKDAVRGAWNADPAMESYVLGSHLGGASPFTLGNDD